MSQLSAANLAQLKNLLASASATAVLKALAGLPPKNSTAVWLSDSSRYARRTLAKIDGDLTPGTSALGAPMTDYIAASIPLHCADGWSYLAGALDCVTRGETKDAIHFAYYAELRAAFSILATQGIGIFKRKHFVVTARNRCIKVPWNFGTHEMAWLILREWAALPDSGQRLLKILTAGSINLYDWIEAFAGSTAVAGSLAEKWLLDWGIDLQKLANDQDERNDASYRPHDIPLRQLHDVGECSEFLTDLWSTLEPSTSSFESLDQYLLRIALIKIFRNMQPRVRRDGQDFRRHVDAMFAKLPISTAQKGPMRGFFLARGEIAPRLIRLAEDRSPRYQFQYQRVIARAVLLLRLATGFAASSMKDAGYSRSDIDFWIDRWGINKGIWSAGMQPMVLSDLWENVATAIEDERVWISAQPAQRISVNQWRAGRLATLDILSACDRIMLWGISL